MKFINYFNLRTFFAIIISQIAVFIAIRFQIKFHLDLLLFSLCVVFPLHFSMQAAFKRRDRALEYFSMFKGATIALYHSFRISEDLPAEKKKEANNLINGVVTQLMDQLENRRPGYESLQLKINEIFSFVEKFREEISKRNVLRTIRYLQDVTESSTFIVSLINHRTMAGMRFYSIFFILIFPVLQAPIILSRLDTIVPYWVIHIFLALTSLILVTLNNFQTLIEYPFDKRGMDNIQIEDFALSLKD